MPTRTLKSATELPAATSSAAVETARDRLRQLEQESSKLDEALNRWRFVGFDKSLPHKLKSMEEKRPAPPAPIRNLISAAYLTNIKSTNSIPTLRQFALNWPLPFTVKYISFKNCRTPNQAY